MIMSTIFAVYNSDGCIGRCDSKCHNATQPDCHCICGGAYHGVGDTIAREDRSCLTDDEILSNLPNPTNPQPLRVFRRPEQLELFK